MFENVYGTKISHTLRIVYNMLEYAGYHKTFYNRVPTVKLNDFQEKNSEHRKRDSFLKVLTK